MKRIVLVVMAVVVMVAGQAWGFDPSGSYTFKEKGMSGSMEVKEIPAPKGGTVIQIKLDSMNSQTNMCEVATTGERIISSDNSIEAAFSIPKEDYQEEQTKFTIKFSPKGAVISVTSGTTNVCGMNAYFEGKWLKNSAKRKATKK